MVVPALKFRCRHGWTVGAGHYMREEGTKVPRSEFVAHLRSCTEDRVGFCTDMTPLLRKDLGYDPRKAGSYVEDEVLSWLPE